MKTAFSRKNRPQPTTGNSSIMGNSQDVFFQQKPMTSAAGMDQEEPAANIAKSEAAPEEQKDQAAG